MNCYIDCEWNDFRGELISMALVAEDGRELYFALGCPDPSPWIAEHVMPVIGIDPVPRYIAQAKLKTFLSVYSDVHIIADWPEDIAQFCNFLITGPGERINTPNLTFEINRSLDSTSLVPHNALEDARANKRAVNGVRVTATPDGFTVFSQDPVPNAKLIAAMEEGRAISEARALRLASQDPL